MANQLQLILVEENMDLLEHHERNAVTMTEKGTDTSQVKILTLHVRVHLHQDLLKVEVCVTCPFCGAKCKV